MSPVSAPQKGILKNAYPQGGPISQMNESMPMMNAIRARMNSVKKTNAQNIILK